MSTRQPTGGAEIAPEAQTMGNVSDVATRVISELRAIKIGASLDFDTIAKFIIQRALSDAIATSNAELLEQLKAALRYIEVQNAYQGAMTAAKVEEAILESKVGEVAIGANSCNTLARFSFTKARAAILKATQPA